MSLKRRDLAFNTEIDKENFVYTFLGKARGYKTRFVTAIIYRFLCENNITSVAVLNTLTENEMRNLIDNGMYMSFLPKDHPASSPPINLNELLSHLSATPAGQPPSPIMSSEDIENVSEKIKPIVQDVLASSNSEVEDLPLFDEADAKSDDSDDILESLSGFGIM